MYLSVEGHQTFKVKKYLDVATRDDGTVEAEIDMNISAVGKSKSETRKIFVRVDS